MSVFGPVNGSFNSGGLKWLNNTTGEASNQKALYGNAEPGTFAKAGGLGDVEFICSSAPIEIGNLVWLDTDNDGVQDADEAGIAGVIVKLFKADGTTEIASATTDANGHYIFSNAPSGTGSAPSHIYNLAMLMADLNYFVRIENASGGSQQGVLMTPGLSLTTDSVGEGSNNDVNDSDGSPSGTNANAPVVAADLPMLGANNHTFDFGFFPPPPPCSVSLTATAGICVPATNQYQATGDVSFTNAPATGTMTVTIGAETQVFNAPFTSPQAYTITGLTSDGAVHAAGVAFSDAAACTGTTNYTAPADCTPVCPPARCGTVMAVKN